MITTAKSAKIVFILPAILILLFATSAPQFVYGANPSEGQYGLTETAERATLKNPNDTKGSQQRVNEIIAIIIKTIIGLTGVAFMVMLLASGELWLTSGGNEEKVKKARDMIFHAIIGVLITLAAYVTTNFIIKIALKLAGAT